MLIVLTAALKLMPWGNRLLAVGGSWESAHSRGVRVDRVKLSSGLV
jgi:ribose transport system permease protein